MLCIRMYYLLFASLMMNKGTFALNNSISKDEHHHTDIIKKSDSDKGEHDINKNFSHELFIFAKFYPKKFF